MEKSTVTPEPRQLQTARTCWQKAQTNAESNPHAVASNLHDMNRALDEISAQLDRINVTHDQIYEVRTKAGLALAKAAWAYAKSDERNAKSLHIPEMDKLLKSVSKTRADIGVTDEQIDALLQRKG